MSTSITNLSWFNTTNCARSIRYGKVDMFVVNYRGFAAVVCPPKRLKF